MHGQNDTFKDPYKFVSETSRWIEKQVKNKVIDLEANKQSIRALVKRNNRQMGIFEMINGQRYKSFTRFLFIKNKDLKDLLLLILSILPISSNFLKFLYLKRISLGLIN